MRIFAGTGVGRCFGCCPGKKVSMMRMRLPQQGQGCSGALGSSDSSGFVVAALMASIGMSGLRAARGYARCCWRGLGPVIEQSCSGAALLPYSGEQFECTTLVRVELTFFMQSTDRIALRRDSRRGDR
jgi:hypothetical protein